MFQSTPSGGKATERRSERTGDRRFQSTPSGGKATSDYATITVGKRVSIHAFRGEGDYIHAASRIVACTMFQSTPSGGKATKLMLPVWEQVRRFNPRLPGGRRPHRQHQFVRRGGFNPRLPGGRRLAPVARRPARRCGFNPRLPGGRRRGSSRPVPAAVAVSIHAFRGEGDCSACVTTPYRKSFNPRLPGGRRLAPTYKLMLPVWVSIHAFRGEGDGAGGVFLLFEGVSIHAFRGEGDTASRKTTQWSTFQSTPSGGKATPPHPHPC